MACASDLRPLQHILTVAGMLVAKTGPAMGSHQGLNIPDPRGKHGLHE